MESVAKNVNPAYMWVSPLESYVKGSENTATTSVMVTIHTFMSTHTSGTKTIPQKT